jgi:hypothetical protein
MGEEYKRINSFFLVWIPNIQLQGRVPDLFIRIGSEIKRFVRLYRNFRCYNTTDEKKQRNDETE